METLQSPPIFFGNEYPFTSFLSEEEEDPLSLLLHSDDTDIVFSSPPRSPLSSIPLSYTQTPPNPTPQNPTPPSRPPQEQSFSLEELISELPNEPDSEFFPELKFDDEPDNKENIITIKKEDTYNNGFSQIPQMNFFNTTTTITSPTNFVEIKEPEKKNILKHDKKRLRKRSHHESKDVITPNPEVEYPLKPLQPVLVPPTIPIHPFTPNVIFPRNNFSETPVIPLSIHLTRDELLTLSSEDFEKHVQKIMEQRTLTTSEKADIKRQRRLIKNRESAQASRQRKKDFVGDLEKKVGDLVYGNSKLKELYCSLTAENRQLQNEVEFLTALVQRVKVY